MLWISVSPLDGLLTQIPKSYGQSVVIAQALAALEQGTSTDVWLSMLKQ